MSDVENSLEITAIKQELSNKIKFSEMTNVQKRSVIDQLFPNGVAFHYTDPKVAIGDFVYGWGNASLNSGGFFFASVVSVPITGDANLNYRSQS